MGKFAFRKAKLRFNCDTLESVGAVTISVYVLKTYLEDLDINTNKEFCFDHRTRNVYPSRQSRKLYKLHLVVKCDDRQRFARACILILSII